METGLRTVGGLLQLFGVSTVAYELHAAIARYQGEPNVVERLVRWAGRVRWRVIRQYRRLRGRAVGRTVNLEAVASIGVSASGTAIVLTGERAHRSFDGDPERVRYLFDRLESAFTRLDRLQDTLNQTQALCRERHEELKGQVQETDERITSVAEAIEAGSVRLRTTGFVCVLAGIVYTTWAPELAATLLGPGLMLAITLSCLSFFSWSRPAGS